MRGLMVLLLFAFSGCANRTTGITDIPDYNYMAHWPEAENRILNWLYLHQECSQDYVVPTITLREGNPATCTYNGRSHVVTYKPETLEGCIAHELGHGALEQAGNDCWRDYEHDCLKDPSVPCSAPQRP